MPPAADVMESKVATANKGMGFAFLQCWECNTVQLGTCQEAESPLHLRAVASRQHQRVVHSSHLPHDAQLADPSVHRRSLPVLVLASVDNVANRVHVHVHGRVGKQTIVLSGKTVEVVARAVGADEVRIAGDRTLTARGLAYRIVVLTAGVSQF